MPGESCTTAGGVVFGVNVGLVFLLFFYKIVGFNLCVLIFSECCNYLFSLLYVSAVN